MAKKTTKPAQPVKTQQGGGKSKGDAGDRGVHGEIGKAGDLGKHTFQGAK